MLANQDVDELKAPDEMKIELISMLIFKVPMRNAENVSSVAPSVPESSNSSVPAMSLVKNRELFPPCVIDKPVLRSPRRSPRLSSQIDSSILSKRNIGVINIEKPELKRKRKKKVVQ